MAIWGRSFSTNSRLSAAGGRIRPVSPCLASPRTSSTWFGLNSAITETLSLRPGGWRRFSKRAGPAATQFSTVGAYARFVVDGGTDLGDLIAAIEKLDPEIEVVSAGRQLQIVKQVGSPANLEKTYGISHASGTHGLGHTRLSTESRVDLSHSQPFWSHGRPDVAIVHNGHITNYHQLRRRYQQRGVRFYTENDSEVVAIYIGDQIGRGRSLEEALGAMLGELDGSYSCLAATATHIGFVKDPFALKPLLWARTDHFVAMANEEIAIRAALPGAYPVREAQAKEVRVWAR